MTIRKHPIRRWFQGNQLKSKKVHHPITLLQKAIHLFSSLLQYYNRPSSESHPSIRSLVSSTHEKKVQGPLPPPPSAPTP